MYQMRFWKEMLFPTLPFPRNLYSQVTLNDITKLPLQLSCSWKCDSSTTDYQLDLTYIASCLPFSPKPSLTNVTATVSVDGGVTGTQSSPPGTWSEEHSRLLWSVGEMRPVENPGQ